MKGINISLVDLQKRWFKQFFILQDGKDVERKTPIIEYQFFAY